MACRRWRTRMVTWCCMRWWMRFWERWARAISARCFHTDPRWKNAASRLFVEGAMRQAKAMGYAVANVDVTILAERPRLKAYKSKMCRKLARMVGGEVNVKAGTNEGCDAVGRGEAIAALAVVLLKRKGSP